MERYIRNGYSQYWYELFPFVFLFFSLPIDFFFFMSIKREKIRSFIPVKNTITLDTLKFERE